MRGNDHNRSTTLAAVMARFPEDIEYISLPKEIREVDRPLLAASTRIRHFGYEFNDFTDTAALCASVDLIISVNNSVTHPSGALGKPVWPALPYSPGGRWRLNQADRLHNASTTNFRQRKAVDWQGLLGGGFPMK